MLSQFYSPLKLTIASIHPANICVSCLQTIQDGAAPTAPPRGRGAVLHPPAPAAAPLPPHCGVLSADGAAEGFSLAGLVREVASRHVGLVCVVNSGLQYGPTTSCWPQHSQLRRDGMCCGLLNWHRELQPPGNRGCCYADVLSRF